MKIITLDDIEEYAGRYTRYSDYLAMLCPWHDDDSPSMLVFDDGYSCRACGVHGTLEYLYQKISGKHTKIIVPTKPPRTSYLWGKWLQKFGSIENICKIAHDYVLSNGCKYFKDRFVQSMVQYCYLGYIEGFVTFPIFDKDHKIIGCVARATPSIQTKQVRFSVSPDCNALYVPDWKRVLESDYLLVVFGIFDALGLSICGYPVVTGIAGASFNSELLDEFRKPIYVIPDYKEERQALELISQLDWRGTLLQLDWPDGTKDCSDIREQYDNDTLTTLIRRSINVNEMDSKFGVSHRIGI